MNIFTSFAMSPFQAASLEVAILEAEMAGKDEHGSKPESPSPEHKRVYGFEYGDGI